MVSEQERDRWYAAAERVRSANRERIAQALSGVELSAEERTLCAQMAWGDTESFVSLIAKIRAL